MLQLTTVFKSNSKQMCLESTTECRQTVCFNECVNIWRQQLNSYEKQIESQVIDSNNFGAFYKHINNVLPTGTVLVLC